MFLLTAAAPDAQVSGFAYIFMFVFVGTMFFFLLIWPNIREQKRLGDLRNDLKPGDQVTFSGGIIGVVSKVEENKVQLKIASNVQIQVLKTAIEAKLSADMA